MKTPAQIISERVTTFLVGPSWTEIREAAVAEAQRDPTLSKLVADADRMIGDVGVKNSRTAIDAVVTRLHGLARQDTIRTADPAAGLDPKMYV